MNSDNKVRIIPHVVNADTGYEPKPGRPRGQSETIDGFLTCVTTPTSMGGNATKIIYLVFLAFPTSMLDQVVSSEAVKLNMSRRKGASILVVVVDCSLHAAKLPHITRQLLCWKGSSD